MSLVARGGSLLVGSDGKLTTNDDCCCGIVCDDYDCSDYTLEKCECVDFETGSIRLLSSFLLHITGATNGGDSPPHGTSPVIPSQVLPVVDYSGTYEFPRQLFFGECGGPFRLYIIDSQYLGTTGGQDYWAVLFIWINLGFFLESFTALCDIGTEPTSASYEVTWNLLNRMERWVLAFSLVPVCGLDCLCPSNPTGILGSAYTSFGPYGHGLDGTGGPSGTYELVY